MADKTFTYTNDFDNPESPVSGNLTTTSQPGTSPGNPGGAPALNTTIQASRQDGDADRELVLYDGRNVGGFAEFFREPFRADSDETAKPVISEFTMNARVDLIDNSGASTGNGKINGYSFNFGNTSTLPGGTGGALENGVSEGLAIRVLPASDRVQIVWNGTVLSQVVSQNSGDFAANLEFLRVLNMNVSVSETGLVRLIMNEELNTATRLELTAQIPQVDGRSGLTSADQSDWGFSFAGRTGLNAGEVWVDDITLSGRIVCFAKGTLITTATGPKAVEDLQTGDLVLTLDHGYQPLRWIGSWHADAPALAAKPQLQPILIRQNALGPQMPSADLTVSPQHRILVASAIVERMCKVPEVCVAAKHLLGHPGVEIAATPEGVTYYHFLCDAHEIVMANGAWAESLLIAPQMYQSLPWSSVTRIFQLFPRLLSLLDNPQPARANLARKQARKLVERHVRNNKPLVTAAFIDPKVATKAG